MIVQINGQEIESKPSKLSFESCGRCGTLKDPSRLITMSIKAEIVDLGTINGYTRLCSECKNIFTKSEVKNDI